MGRKSYYAVNQGYNPGVYNNWNDCQDNVSGYSGAVYKKFDTYAEAQAFSNQGRSSDNYTSSNYSNRGYNNSYSNNNYSNRDYDRGYDDYSSGPSYQRQERTVVYTDGASSNNGRGHARAGYGVYYGDNDPRNTSARLQGDRQTNQRAEAEAVNHALRQSRGNENLDIRTDSQYVIKAATDWSNKWENNGWVGSNGREVQNRDLFQEMRGLINSREGDTTFTYVPGHSGNEGNDKADNLAVRGAQKDRYY